MRRLRDYNSNLPFQVSRFAHLQKPCEICYEEPGGAPRIFEPATVPNLTKSTCFLTVMCWWKSTRGKEDDDGAGWRRQSILLINL